MPTVNGPVRARDLRANIKEHGFETGMVMTLELLLDEHTQDRQTMREMASMLERVVDHMDRLMAVGSSITQELDRMKRDRQAGDEIDHSQRDKP